MSSFSSEALARASATHPWRTVAIWVVVLVVAMALNATLLGDSITTEFHFTNNPDSERADSLLEERLRGPRKAAEVIIVQHPELTVDDNAFQARVEELWVEIAALEVEGTPKGEPEPPSGRYTTVAGGTHYYLLRNESLVSKDRHTTIIPFSMSGSFDQAVSNMEKALLDVVRDSSGPGGFEVLIVGESSISAETNELTEQEIRNGEQVGVPVALVILILLFGAVLAALLPLGLAIVGIITALGASALIGGLGYDLIFFVPLMITMIGLAVGIDYSLLVVSRYREEMGRGREKIDALTRTGATASRTVFFSGVTVVIALLGMLILPSTVYQGLAIGAILVVISAVAAALTLLPAVLSLLGHRVNWLRVPIIGRRLDEPSSETSGGFWDWVSRTVMRYPVISIVITAGALIALTIPLLGINTGFNGVDVFPDGVQSKEAFFILEEEFSFGVAAPTEIAIDGDVNSAPVQAAIEQLKQAIASDPDFVLGTQFQANQAGDLGLLTTYVAGEVSSAQATGAIERLRDKHIPEAFAGVDAEALVTGFSAFNLDFFNMASRWTPIVFVVVLAFSFVLLTVVFRSVVVPVKAIIMNLLSVGAAYGLMVLVFQKGVGATIFGFQETEIIDAWIPLFLFSVLFGLSMDYHVFLLSRVRERYDQTGNNGESVAYGLRSTGGLITGAALIMVAVFGGFASGDIVSNQQVGFGLASAVFIDATVVRSILVPASMRLLGKWNWYLPSVLDWLPDIRVEAEEPVVATGSDD